MADTGEKQAIQQQPDVPHGAVVFTPPQICPELFQGNKAQDNATIAQLGLASTQQLLAGIVPDGPQNPPPNTWQHDGSGNVLQAGSRFDAAYDASGNLTRATIGDETYERTGPNQVTETFMGNDGQLHRSITDNVTSFTATPFNGNWHGAFSGVDVEIKFGTGSSTSNQSLIYESPAHQLTTNSFWSSERACESKRVTPTS